eukprot:1490559-Rhodomonas_salina.2
MAVSCYARRGTEIAHMGGSPLSAYALATRCAVLSSRLVLPARLVGRVSRPPNSYSGNPYRAPPFLCDVRYCARYRAMPLGRYARY